MRKFFRNYFANKSPLFVANYADLPAKWYFLYIFITAYWGFSLSICLSEDALWSGAPCCGRDGRGLSVCTDVFVCSVRV